MKNNQYRFLVLSCFIFGFLGGVFAFFVHFYLPGFSNLNSGTGDDQVRIRNNRILEKIEEQSATIFSVEKAGPSVVSIVVTKDLTHLYRQYQRQPFFFDDFFFFGPGFESPFAEPEQEQEQEDSEPIKQRVGGGTGFIVSLDGMILTNKHVVSDPDAEYTVLTQDGEEYEAQILGRDPVNDFAIVKIEPKEGEEFPIIELGDSDHLKIGQTVIAIGYSLGEFRNTVTKGIISGIDRKIVAGGSGFSEMIEEAIQTDAAINPGNSGGPLLDLKGRVIGINTAMSHSGQLIGFAIPINLAKTMIANVKKFGEFVRPFLGVRYRMVNRKLAEEYNLTVDFGAWLKKDRDSDSESVVADSPADRAGLQEGDIILQVNDVNVDDKHSLAKLISQYLPEEKVRLLILRDGVERTLEVQLGKYEEQDNK